jgi:membrane protease YdiL (CAAX protease family)
MLSVKPWKPDAIARLLLSVFVCVYAGSLLATALHYFCTGGKPSLKFLSLLVPALGFLAAALILVRRPLQLEDVLRRMVILLVCFYAGIFLGAWAQKIAGPPGPSVRQMLMATLSFQGAALLLVSLFLREHQLGWRAAFGLGNRWPRALLLGLIVACVFLPVGLGVQWASAAGLDRASGKLAHYFPHLDLKPEAQQAVHTLQMAVTVTARVALGIVTILLAPVAEEVLFRGILYPYVKQAGFPRLALWGTALVFAAIHLNLIAFLPLTLLALTLTALYEYTDNLLAPITAHALFNGLNFTLLYLVVKPAT